MFENIGTALLQAIGFFGIFGFFVYQLISDGNNKNNTQLNTSSAKSNKYINLKDKPIKKGLFGRKTEPIKEEGKPKKKRLFERKKEEDVEEKLIKKGWF